VVPLLLLIGVLGAPAYGQSNRDLITDDKIPEIVSAAPESVALTIYQDNLAFITEVRRIDLPAGRSTISFAGVSDLMIPQTALLREFGALTIERNFDYDLLSKASLFEKSIGREVSIIRTNPKTGEAIEERATIVSAANGVVFDINGRIETFQCSGLPEKITFDSVPDNLRGQPTLSLEVYAQEAGPQELTISYLASGFGWQADYVLRLNDDENTASLLGWLTVENGTEVSVNNAPTAIVAGALQRLYETQAEGFYADRFRAACWPRGSTKRGVLSRLSKSRVRRSEFTSISPVQVISGEGSRNLGVVESSSAGLLQALPEPEDLGDYKLYRTPYPTSVKAYQTKQVAFIDKPEIDVTRFHVFDLGVAQLSLLIDRVVTSLPAEGTSSSPSPSQSTGQTDDETIIVTGARISRSVNVTPVFLPAIGGKTPYNFVNAKIRYDLDNDKDSKLSAPLPQGIVRAMIDLDGEQFYLGEDNVRNLAIGLPVEVTIGESPSVSLSTIVLSAKQKALNNRRREFTAEVEHRINNANDYEVMVEVTQGRNGQYAPLTILQSSHEREADSGYPKWRVPVEANSEAVLIYTISFIR